MEGVNAEKLRGGSGVPRVASFYFFLILSHNISLWRKFLFFDKVLVWQGFGGCFYSRYHPKLFLFHR